MAIICYWIILWSDFSTDWVVVLTEWNRLTPAAIHAHSRLHAKCTHHTRHTLSRCKSNVSIWCNTVMNKWSGKILCGRRRANVWSTWRLFRRTPRLLYFPANDLFWRGRMTWAYIWLHLHNDFNKQPNQNQIRMQNNLVNSIYFCVALRQRFEGEYGAVWETRIRRSHILGNQYSLTIRLVDSWFLQIGLM